MSHEFLPVLTLADWVSVLLLPMLGVVAFLLVVWVSRALTKRGRNAIGILIIGSVLSLALLATPLGQSSRLSRFKFHDSELSISGFGSPFSLLLRHGNNVRIADAAVLLNGADNFVSLPLSGRWSYQGMEVDALYIANEFRGRSQRRDKYGKLLASIKESPNIQTKNGNENKQDKSDSGDSNQLLNFHAKPSPAP